MINNIKIAKVQTLINKQGNKRTLSFVHLEITFKYKIYRILVKMYGIITLKIIKIINIKVIQTHSILHSSS